MSTRVSKGSVVVGDFEVTSSIKEDTLFQWVSALDRSDGGRDTTLQILLQPLASDVLTSISQYIDELQNVNRSRQPVPKMVADATFPLVLVYPSAPGQSLAEALATAAHPEGAVELWQRAADRLHELHNKDLFHGRPSLESFFVSGGVPHLTEFGFAPLLAAGNDVAFSCCDGYLAPEVTGKNEVSNVTDIFAFAKAVAKWRPEIEATPWYLKATDTDPANRYPRIRQSIKELEEAIGSLPAAGPTVAPPTSPPPDTTSPPPTTGKSTPPVPKHRLHIDVVPANGGTVTGAGVFTGSPSVPIEAKAKPGWKFVRWSGDLNSTANPTQITLDSNKAVTANFVSLAKPVLSVRAEPPEGGSVTGGGTFEMDAMATIQARANADWVFSGWGGDAEGFVNPTTIKLDRDMSVVARFAGVPGARHEREPKPSLLPAFVVALLVSLVIGGGYWFNVENRDKVKQSEAVAKQAATQLASSRKELATLLSAIRNDSLEISELKLSQQALLSTIGRTLDACRTANSRKSTDSLREQERQSQQLLANVKQQIAQVQKQKAEELAAKSEEIIDQYVVARLIALRDLEQNRKIGPADSAAWRRTVAGWLDNTLPMTEKALQLDSTNEKAWVQKVRVYVYHEGFPPGTSTLAAAASTLDTALKQFPSNPDLKELQQIISSMLTRSKLRQIISNTQSQSPVTPAAAPTATPEATPTSMPRDPGGRPRPTPTTTPWLLPSPGRKNWKLPG